MNQNELLLNCIYREIFNGKGSGFKVELSPILTKYEVYEWQRISSAVNSNELIWTLSEQSPSRQIYSKMVWYQFHYDQIDTGNLPRGIILEKTSLGVVYDGRIRLPLKKRVEYMEGPQVFLTVSDDFASQIYQERYIDVGIPFRDRILSKHQEILKELTKHIVPSYCSEAMYNDYIDFFVVYKDSVYGSFGEKSFHFRTVGMRSLDSIGQMYGMALALIDTLKEYNCGWNDFHFKISEKDCCIRVDYFYSKELAEQNLKEW